VTTNERHSRGHPGKKPTKVDLFLVGLSCQPTIELASKYAGISPATGFRWLRDPEIKARRQEAARETARQAMVRLREVTNRAVNRLGKLVDHAETEATQVAACRAVLDYNLRTIEIEELREEIEQIQKALKAGTGSWTNGSSQYQPPMARDQTDEEIN
jgi:hypothetical protein